MIILSVIVVMLGLSVVNFSFFEFVLSLFMAVHISLRLFSKFIQPELFYVSLSNQ